MATPPAPPRLTGEAEKDTVILLRWAYDFYKAVVLEEEYATNESVQNIIVTVDGATAENTPDTVVFRDENGSFAAQVITALSLVGALTGNASTATKWATARSIDIAGDGTGTATLDGSTNVTITLTLANNATARQNLGLEIGVNVQAFDSDLTTWAGKTAPIGTVVGTTDSQVLTNKSLTSPNLTGTPTLPNVGDLVRIKEGSNASMGVATLVGGTVTVSNTLIAAGDRIMLSRATAGGVLGHLAYTISAGASFTINSNSATETSTVNWLIIRPAP